MRTIVYDVAVSLDGFIAGPGDDIALFPAEGAHAADYFDRLASYDTVIMGRRTYEFGYAYGLTPGQRAYPHMDHHIFSRSLELPDDRDVDIVRDEWLGEIARLKQSTGGTIYLCGGGRFAGLLDANRLIDRLVLKLAPVTLGGGIPLFGDNAGPHRFRLADTKPYDSGVVLLTYDRHD